MKPAIALVSALLLACGASTSSSSSGAPSTPTTPDTPSTPDAPSSGCAAWTLPRGVTTGTLTVGGVTRSYVLSVPKSGTGPMQVVFAFHGMKSNGTDFRSWLTWMKLESSATRPTVFAYPDGLVGSNGETGWEDAGGRDTAFFDALLAKVEAEACVDEGRVFVMGFSYGAFMSNGLGCRRGGIVRAIAPLSGGGRPGTCSGKRVAVWMATGDKDSLLAGSVSSRDAWAAANACSATTSAVAPSPCVAYAGCAAGDPVVWCPFSGDHTVQSWEPPAVMAFFEGL